MAASKKNFQYCKRWLRRNFPSEHLVRIYCVGQATIAKQRKLSAKSLKVSTMTQGTVDACDDDELDGCCMCWWAENGDTYFVIYIDKSEVSERVKIATLLHEWAHVLQDHVPTNKFSKVHCGAWSSYHKRIVAAWKAHNVS